MDKGIIEKIIEAGNHAPSGGNSQPWRFIVEHDAIKVIMLPEKEHPVLNFKERGTYIAHGALLENMRIAARSLDYEALFNFLPEPGVSAAVTFRPFSEHSGGDDLYSVLFKRHSNRKPYKKHPLSGEEKESLFRAAKDFPGVRLSVVEGETSVRSVAGSVALDILINLENKHLHELFFEEVLWKEEDQHQRPGLYIKTMEAVPPKSSVMRLLGNWKVAQLFSKMKLTHKIVGENAKTLASSGMFGAVIVSNDDRDFIDAGRMIEDIWLRATESGLSFQLIVGLVALGQRVKSGDTRLFSASENETISRAYENLRKIFGVREEEIIAATFRLGEAPPPMAVSYTRPPEIEWL